MKNKFNTSACYFLGRLTAGAGLKSKSIRISNFN